MDTPYDIIVIGAGPGGEVCAAQLGKAGKRVAIIESERVGGECAFWACVPSKVLLRSEEPYNASRRVPGSKSAVTGKPSFDEAARWRTESVSDYDDTEHLPFLRDNNVTLIRGEARVEERGVVRVGDQQFRYGTLVIATGSDPHMPPLDGLQNGRAWTPREATAARTIPPRLAILGAGAVGVELGQFFARYGSRVTIIEPGPHVLAREEPEVATLMNDVLKADGIAVHSGKAATQVTWGTAGVTITLTDGARVDADELLIAAGRVGRSQNFDAAALGMALHQGAICVDDQCRAAADVYAVGDVNGIAMFTHVAKYQGRVAADAILGKDTRARYDAVPRATFTDPEIGSTGITAQQARAQKLDFTTAQVELASAARASLYYDQTAAGFIKLIADKQQRVLVGATIVGPQASEMIGIASTAIAHKVPVDDLLQIIQPFPTFSEAFFYALQAIRWD